MNCSQQSQFTAGCQCQSNYITSRRSVTFCAGDSSHTTSKKWNPSLGLDINCSLLVLLIGAGIYLVSLFGAHCWVRFDSLCLGSKMWNCIVTFGVFFFTSLVAEIQVEGINVCAFSQASTQGSLQKHILWVMDSTAQGAQMPLTSMCVPQTAQPWQCISPTGSKTIPKRGVLAPRAAVLAKELQRCTSPRAQMQPVV